MLEDKDFLETSEKDDEEEKKGMKKIKPLVRKIIFISLAIAVFATIAVIIGIAINHSGYKRAEEKYQAEVERLTEELNDRVATYETVSSEVNISVINTEIKEIGELATIEYIYTDAGKFSDPKQLFGHDVPFTTKSFIAKWDGSIKAGVDVTEISVEKNDMSKTITVHLPKAEIIAHEINNESIETLSESDGLFNPVRVDDVRSFDLESKNAMEQRAIENGLLEKATKNAETLISGIINADPAVADRYKVVFETD